VLIVVIGGAWGWRHESKISALRKEYRGLTGEAERRGISISRAENSGGEPVTKRQRGGSKNVAPDLALKMAAFAREIERRDQEENPADDGFDQRGREILTQLLELDASQIKAVVSALAADGSISEATRENLISAVIAMLGEDHPAAALALFAESADLLKDSLTGGIVVSSTLANWAKQDPAAALAWLRTNAAAHPELAEDDVKRSVIAGAAENNPALAIRLINEMELDDKSTGFEAIVEAGRTPEQRTAILGALRAHLATLPDDERADLMQQSLESMGRNLADESFDSVQSWIAKSKLTPEESANFAAGLSYFNTGEDTGRWIDWMASHLPESAMRDNVDNLIGQWTQQDYLAAGRWLTAAPEGPAKQAAVSTYAGTVAEYEPKVAVQWADTLPEGEQRRRTYETILENWPKSDSAAAEAFAAKHGLKLGRNNIDVIQQDGEDGDSIVPEEGVEGIPEDPTEEP
jgi:hypothetical protein